MEVSKWVYGDEVCSGATGILTDSQFRLAATSQQVH